MKDLAQNALDAVARAASPTPTRAALEIREREVTPRTASRPRLELRIHGDRDSRAGIRLLGVRGHDDLTQAHRIRRGAGARDRALGHGGAEAKVTLAAERKYERISPFRSIRSPIPWTAIWRFWLAVDAELRTSRGSAWRKPRCTSSGGGRCSHPPWGASSTRPAARRAPVCGPQLQGWRDPAALLSQFVRRAVSVEGYELVEELRTARKRAARGGRGGGAALRDQCPEGEFDLILDSSQLVLQIHESIGHPIELDRVLGSEANYAGMSFLTLDQLDRLRYARRSSTW